MIWEWFKNELNTWSVGRFLRKSIPFLRPSSIIYWPNRGSNRKCHLEVNRVHSPHSHYTHTYRMIAILSMHCVFGKKCSNFHQTIFGHKFFDHLSSLIIQTVHNRHTWQFVLFLWMFWLRKLLVNLYFKLFIFIPQ